MVAAGIVRVCAAAVGHRHAVHICHAHRAAILRGIGVVGDRFVPAQREFLHVRRHDQLLVVQRRCERGIHLLIDPVLQAVDVSAAARDRRVHLGADFRVKRRRAAHRGLIHEAPDLTLQRLAGRILPEHASQRRSGQIGAARVEIH